MRSGKWRRVQGFRSSRLNGYGMVNADRKKWVLRVGMISVLIIFTGIVLSEYLCQYCPQVPDPGEGRTYVKGCDGHQVYLTFAESIAPTIVSIVGGNRELQLADVSQNEIAT